MLTTYNKTTLDDIRDCREFFLIRKTNPKSLKGNKPLKIKLVKWKLIKEMDRFFSSVMFKIKNKENGKEKDDIFCEDNYFLNFEHFIIYIISKGRFSVERGKIKVILGKDVNKKFKKEYELDGDLKRSFKKFIKNNPHLII